VQRDRLDLAAQVRPGRQRDQAEPGPAGAELERDGTRLTAEIRSVNHRFCEVSLRSPKVVGLFEDRIRQLISERFSRGKFNLTITWSGAGEAGEELQVNETGDRWRKIFMEKQIHFL